MLNIEIEKATTAWATVSKILYIPHSEKEYQEAVRLLDDLIDIVGEDETHPLSKIKAPEVQGLLFYAIANERQRAKQSPIIRRLLRRDASRALLATT